MKLIERIKEEIQITNDNNKSLSIFYKVSLTNEEKLLIETFKEEFDKIIKESINIIEYEVIGNRIIIEMDY